MSRWYMVRLTDGKGNYRDIESSGNTRRSAERTSRSKLRDIIGDEVKKWSTTRIVPCAPPVDR